MSEEPIHPDTPDGAGSPSNEDNGPDRNSTLAGLWVRVVELEREARWLSAKCDHLRHSCRGLLQTVGSPGPLTDEQVRLITAESPRRSQAEAIEEAIRLREERSAGLPPVPSGSTVEQLSRRVAELQPVVAALTTQREALRPIFLALAEAFEPFAPPTQEEVEEMLRAADGTPGPSILDLINEVERELRT
ncbi:MAG TPA: hypothetical protein VM533_11015 [Fimbriiglobus sp.]|jgi:hypothetical protein|nr:hypothetical protein [Fimbriiglobus sp.]